MPPKVEISFFCSKCILFFVNIAFLMAAYSISQSDSMTYGITMQSETEDWNENSIVDVIASTTPCPNGYEQIQSRFPGTDTICSGPLSYSRGSCSRKQVGFTVWGLSATVLDTVNGVRVCVKRLDLNYHELVDMRSGKENCCGSPTDSERRFCSPQPFTCPLNEI